VSDSSALWGGGENCPLVLWYGEVQTVIGHTTGGSDVPGQKHADDKEEEIEKGQSEPKGFLKKGGGPKRDERREKMFCNEGARKPVGQKAAGKLVEQ